jgi:hypothetical protein
MKLISAAEFGERCHYGQRLYGPPALAATRFSAAWIRFTKAGSVETMRRKVGLRPNKEVKMLDNVVMRTAVRLRNSDVWPGTVK